MTAKIISFPSPNEWTYFGVQDCAVFVRDERKPLTIEAVIYLLEMAKAEMLAYCKGEESCP